MDDGINIDLLIGITIVSALLINMCLGWWWAFRHIYADYRSGDDDSRWIYWFLGIVIVAVLFALEDYGLPAGFLIGLWGNWLGFLWWQEWFEKH